MLKPMRRGSYFLRCKGFTVKRARNIVRKRKRRNRISCKTADAFTLLRCRLGGMLIMDIMW